MRIRPLVPAMLLAAVAGAGVAAQPQPYSGNADYQTYCSSCHGTDAKGEGVIAKSLRQKPSDLTQLSKRNDGQFPDERVFKAIDGRNSDSHRDMPAWADVFGKSADSAGPEKAAARIDVLVKYLQTLQAR